MNITKLVKTSACLVIGTYCTFSLKDTYYDLSFNKSFVIFLDPAFSPHAQQQIKQFVKTSCTEKSSPETAALLLQHFPSIQKVSLRKKIHDSDTTQLIVRAERPIRQLNNYVVTNNNKMVPLVSFKSIELPLIHSDVQQINSAMIHFAATTPYQIMQEYDVSIKNPHTALLHNQEDPTIHIITNPTQVLSEDMVHLCQKLLKEKITKKNKKKLYADIRFENQILVYEDI